MDVRILGPLELRAAGRGLELGGPRPRALLALLILRAPQVVAADRLVDELWSERPPRSAPHLLHVYVSTLRKSLAAASASPLLVTRPPGYLLDVRDDEIDARRFERLLAEGRRLLALHEPDRAATTLREALALWRGPALADFTYDPFAQAEIARLEELRLAARELRIDADLELGGHAQLVGELEAFAAEQPLRERAWEQLMLALYRSGRQTEALEAYREGRRRLVSELGLEPGAALRRLEHSILTQDPALDVKERGAAEAAAPPALKPVTAVVTAVPPAAGGAVDSEARRAYVDRLLGHAAAVLARHGATTETLPDERVVAIFGVPVVRDDDALRALRAAVELRETRDLSIGVETGEALVADGGTSGGPIVPAARLCGSAAAGEVLLGEEAKRVVHHAVVTEPGRDNAAVRVLELREQASPLPHREDAPLVGRERELTELHAAYERAVADGTFTLVTVVGDAGVGKSRLGRELTSMVANRAHTLVGRSPLQGEGVTYWALREIVRQAVGAETPAAVRRSLRGDDRDAVAAAVAGALGTGDAAPATAEVQWAFRRLFEQLAGERPLVLVFEDVHLADPALLDVVRHLGDRVVNAPVLALALARPELLEQQPDWPEPLRLEPLAESASEALVEQLVGRSAVSERARARILEAAGGNPLFLEQLVAMLGDVGGSADEVVVPPTVRALLASRIDRLGPAERGVLQLASVAGRTVRTDAVASLLPEQARPPLERHLEALVRKGYLELEAHALRFRHALVQEAAYRSISKERRADLHDRLGEWLEHSHEAEEVVGYHLEHAFRLRQELDAVDWHARRLASRATELLGAAGRRALARQDVSAAANLLGRAVAVQEDDDPARLALLPVLAETLRERSELTAAQALVDEAVARAVEQGEAAVEADARIERAYLSLMTERAPVAEARAEAERALRVFQRLGDDSGSARAWLLIALTLRLEGKQSERRIALEHAFRHAGRAGSRRSEGLALDALGGVHNYGPSTVQALLEYGQMTYERARANATPLHEADALAHGLGRPHAMLGDFDAARGYIARARAIVDELDAPWCRAGVASAAGFVELLAGDAQAAEQELRRGLEAAQRAGLTGSYFAHGLNDELAQALCAQGRFEEAGELADLTESRAAEDDKQAQVAWRSVRAKALAHGGDVDRALPLARAAVELAEQTELVLVRAQALLDLTEVLRLAGRADEAAAPAERALQLYEEKGDLVSAKRVRSLLVAVRRSARARRPRPRARSRAGGRE